MAYALDLVLQECRKCYAMATVVLMSRDNVALGEYCENCVKQAKREQRQAEEESDRVTKPTK
jgi:NMD protein affecting ribosome stability and mRNA decay